MNNRLLTLEISTPDLYEIFLHEIMKQESEGHNKEILEKIRKGIDVKFSFEDFVKERYTKKTYVKVKGGKEVGGDIKKIKISGEELMEEEFEDEILRRVRLMRGWLWENMTVEKVGTLREVNDGTGD